MQKIQGWVENGNTKVVVSGLLSTTLTQKSFPLATVTVYISGTVTPAQIYSDSVGTALGNPLTANATGMWGFFAANGAYDVVFSGTGVSAPFTLSSLWVFDENSVFVDVTASPFFADKTGAIDSTAAIQAAINSVPAGNVFFPAGTYTVSSPLLVKTHGLSLIGTGQRATFIHYTGSGSCFKLDFTAPSTIAQNRVIGFGFDGTSNTNVKTALQIVDGEEIEVRDIAVSNWHDGANFSIGLQFQGRQAHSISLLTIFADKPVSIERNPNDVRDCDHYHFQDCYLAAPSNANPVITVADGVALTNLTFDGYQAWVFGTYGLKFSSTTDILASYEILIENVRWEQGVGPGGFAVYLSNLNGFRNVNLVDIRTGSNNQNGFYLKDIAGGAMVGCSYASLPSAVILQTVGDIRMSFIGNDLSATGGTFSFAANSMINSVWMNNDGVSSVGLGVPNPTHQLVILNNTAVASLNGAGNAEIVMVEVDPSNSVRIAPAGQVTLIGGRVQVGTGTGVSTSHEFVIPNGAQYAGENVGNTDSIAIAAVTNTNTLIFDAGAVGSRFGGQVILNLPIFANNAAALGGGLTAGMLYRTGADPDPVSIVH